MPTLVPAAIRAMALFELFADQRRELSNSDLARLLGMPESSCSDLLHTLSEMGYLVRTVRTRRFYPSARLFRVAREITTVDPLYFVAQEATDLLCEKTGETALAGRIESGVVKVLAFTESAHPLRYMQKVGDKLSLHVSAMGKAQLALGSDEQARAQLRLKPLRKLFPETITDLGVLLGQVQRAREQGWLWVENEGGEGLAALAVAGWACGEPIALSVAGPTDRLRQHKRRYLALLGEVQALVLRPTSARELAPA